MAYTVGIIGDTHLPFELTDYLEFCVNTFETFGVDRVVHIGDLIDGHALSYHEHDPDGWSVGDEIEQVRRKIHHWIDAFPKVDWVQGNHDMLPGRKAKTAGLSKLFIRTWDEVLGLPHKTDWNMCDHIIIDSVLYQHGLGCGGKYGYSNAADFSRMSVVQGHAHCYSGIAYKSSFKDTIFGMGVGCAIERSSYAMYYAKYRDKKPVTNCGIVIDGQDPFLIQMKQGGKNE